MLCAVKIKRASLPQRRFEACKRRADPIGVRSDEHLVIEPVADVGHLDVRKSGAGEMGPGFGDVLAILRAARVAAVRGGNEADGPPDALPGHGLERIGEVGVPVAHSYEDRQRRPGSGEALPQAIRLRLRQLREGRSSTDDFVVMRDFVHAPGRYSPSTQDVGEERADVLGCLGTAKSDQQYRVEGMSHVSLSRLYRSAPPVNAASSVRLRNAGLLYSWFSHEENSCHQ